MNNAHIVLLTIFFICVTLKAVIPPTRITELQTLTNNIETGAITASEAQRLFSAFVSQLSVYDRKSSVVLGVIQAAERKKIPLFIDTVEVTHIPKEGAKKAAEIEKPTIAGSPLPTQVPIQVPAQERVLSAKELEALKNAITLLKKEHKSMTLEMLTKSIDAIDERTVGAKVPKELDKEFFSIFRFKLRLENDLAFLKNSGNELASFFDTGIYKGALIDPKAIKEFIKQAIIVTENIKAIPNGKMHAAKKNIESKIDITASKIYPNNKEIESAVYEALNKVKDIVYKTFRHSMQKLLESPDNTLLRKLVRAYEQGIEKFPTQQHIDKQHEKAQTKMITDLLNNIASTYTKINPEEVDKKLTQLEGKDHLLNPEQNKIANLILDYLDETYIHIGILDGADSFLEKAKAFITTQSTDMRKIENKLSMLFAYEDECDKILQRQIALGGIWLLDRVHKTIARLAEVGKELNALAIAAEEKKYEEENLFESVEQWYAEHNVVPKTPQGEASRVSPSLISKEYSKTPAERKIQQEHEIHITDILTEQQLEK